MPDELTTDADLMKAQRELRAIRESMPADVKRNSDLTEIYEALDTWLGQDLSALQPPLWGGDRASLHIRQASTDEAQRWHASLQEAINTGEEDAGEESWAVYLV